MSDNTLTVRDHSQPCKHGERLIRAANGNEGRNIGHFVETEGGGFGDGVWCDGGREIVLRRDYEPVKVRWPCTDEGLSDEFWAVRVPHDGKWFVVEVSDED